MRIVFHQHTHRKMFEAWFKRTHPTGTRDVIESYWESLRGLGLHLEDPGTPLYELYQKKGKPVTLAEEQDLARRKELVHAFCEGHVAEVRTAVIYEKPQSVIRPDYSWRLTERWIDFPWSVLPPVVDPAAQAH